MKYLLVTLISLSTLLLSNLGSAQSIVTLNITPGATPIDEAETFIDLIDTQRSECLVRFKPYNEILFYSKKQTQAFLCGDLATYAKTGERICLSQVDLIARMYKYVDGKMFNVEKVCLASEVAAIKSKPDLVKLFSPQ
jgi:hypothetical protein